MIGMNDTPDLMDIENDYLGKLRCSTRCSSVAADGLDLEERAIPARSPFLDLLLRSAIWQSRKNSDRQHYRRRPNQVHFNNRRYAPQSFHAMRG